MTEQEKVDALHNAVGMIIEFANSERVVVRGTIIAEIAPQKLYTDHFNNSNAINDKNKPWKM